VQLFIFTLLAMGGAGVSIAVAFFLRHFVNIATGVPDDSLIRSIVGDSLLRTGLLSTAVIAGGGIITIAMSILGQYIFGKTERNLRSELMDVIMSRRMLDISGQHTGELLTKLTVDTQAVSNCFINISQSMIGGAASAVGAIVAIFFIDWRMALIMLGLAPVLMLVMGVFSPFMEKASKVDVGNEEINRSLMQENLSRIMLVKTYFMRSKVNAKIKKEYANKLKSGLNLGKWTGLVTFSGELVGWGMFMVAIGVGSFFVMRGDTTIGNLIGMVQLLNYVVGPVAGFAGAVALVAQAKASASRIGEICELPADEERVKLAKPVDAVELVADGVSFNYSDDGENILENISAVFKKGDVTGIVGKSGSGKSTLLKLLIGLYTPQHGKIELKHFDGVLGSEEIMPQIAYVPPVDYLFSASVLENIIMSESEARMDDIKIAAADANILDFIEALPDKFETQIGEGGGGVSSGQAQRLAIARAIYKKSPVIVFDEPTANLDVESIEKFQETVKAIAQDKICIIVTHDVSTIGVCDKIYIIEDGGMREKMSDEDLVLGDS